MAVIDTSGLQSLNPFTQVNQKNILAERSKEKKRAQKANKAPFYSILGREVEQADEVSKEASLPDLLDGVHIAGDALKKRPLPDEIRRYKNAVKKFVSFVVENSFEIKEQTGILNRYKPQYENRKPEERGRRNKYKIISVIDQKLETLAAGVISGQLEQLKLLAAIDEISGLVVNLLE